MLRLILLAAAFLQSVGVAGAYLSAPAVGPHRLGYDAVETRSRRRQIAVETRREDEILNGAQRQQLTTNTRDIRRNFSLAAWMVRKHLDFVSRFRFQAGTSDKIFNRDYEQAVKEWSKRGNCEASRRFRLAKVIRHAEAHRTLDGDHGLLKLDNGSGLLQLIEGDRIRSPLGVDGLQWTHGVKLSPTDEPQAYAIHKRKRGGGYEFEREVPAENLFLHAYRDRVDQVRGISPLASGVNDLCDVYENKGFALARSKIEQLLGLIFTASANDDGTTGYGQHTPQTAADDGDDTGTTDGPKYDVDFGRGPWKLELDPGDDVKTLQSTNPSSQFLAFHEAVIQIAMKALDLPYCFYDEAHTNFHGSLRAVQLYMRSCKDRIEDNQELLADWLAWRTAIEIKSGNFSLPTQFTARSIPCQWVPDGTPWWDKAREITGDRLAVASAFDNPQRICADHGTDFFDNVDRIKEAVEYAREAGFDLKFDAANGPSLIDPDQLAEALGNAG